MVGMKVWNEKAGFGVVVGTDPDHYHATQNGRTVYVVRWARSGDTGTGWTAEDLRVC